jgi:tetratricopeptide (TPR) repeat protein
MLRNFKVKNLQLLGAASALILTLPLFAITYTPSDDTEAPPQNLNQPAPQSTDLNQTQQIQQTTPQQETPQQAAAPQQATPGEAELQQQAAQNNPWKIPPNVLDVVRIKGQAALLTDPNNSYVLQEVGIILLFGNQDDVKQGEQFLARAIQINQNDLNLIEKLTQFIQIAGNTGIQTADQMRRFFEVVLKSNPKDANANAQLGAVYELGGEGLQRNFLKAKQLYETALSIDPKNKIALLGLANILKTGGDGVAKDEARANDLLNQYQQSLGNTQAPASKPSPTQQQPLPKQGTPGQPQQATPDPTFMKPLD